MKLLMPPPQDASFRPRLFRKAPARPRWQGFALIVTVLLLAVGFAFYLLVAAGDLVDGQHFFVGIVIAAPVVTFGLLSLDWGDLRRRFGRRGNRQ